MNRRDLKNIQILCNFWAGDIEESVAMSSLVLKQTTAKGKSKYIKKLIAIIRDEETLAKARRNHERTEDSNIEGI